MRIGVLRAGRVANRAAGIKMIWREVVMVMDFCEIKHLDSQIRNIGTGTLHLTKHVTAAHERYMYKYINIHM